MAQNTIVALAVDFANTDHVSALAQIMALATQAGIAIQVGVGASASAVSESKPARERKPLADTADTFVRLAIDGKHVTFQTPDGKYLGTAGIRKVMNARVKDGGATWDADKKAWAFKSAQAARKWAVAQADAAVKALTPEGQEPDASKFPEGDFALVTAREWADQREKAQARAERKAGKGA